MSTEINNGNVHKILSTYIPKPLTPSTTATPKPKQSTPAVSQPKKVATVANKPKTPTTQPKKPTTTVTKPTAPKATPIQPAKPVDRVAQVWQKNNELVKENYDTPHWSTKS